MAAQAESSGKPQKPKSRIPTAASSWDKETLNLLNAKFNMDAESRQGDVLDIDVQMKIPEIAQNSM